MELKDKNAIDSIICRSHGHSESQQYYHDCRDKSYISISDVINASTFEVIEASKRIKKITYYNKLYFTYAMGRKP